MKFCSECGSKLPIGTVKFCSSCGASLWATTLDTSIPEGRQPTIANTKEYRQSNGEGEEEQRLSSNDKSIKEDEINGEFQNQTNHSLGVKFEEIVEQILKNMGYSTETRVKLEGERGTRNEIDILGKQTQLLAVECKNYREARIIGIKEIRDFHSKIRDLPQITDALFVTNAAFSSEAKTYAEHNHITLWDGEKLKNEFYLMNIKRLGAATQDIILDFSLPISMGFMEATKIELVNPKAVRIARASLVLYPFYIFDYVVNAEKGHFLRRHTVHEGGTHIIDAMTAEPLEMEEKVVEAKKWKSRIYSTLFSKSRTHSKHSEELLNDMEKDQIIQDLRKIKPHHKYNIRQSADYAVIKLESKVPIDVECREIKEEVVNEYKVRYDEVKITSSCIYIPKWVINIESQNSTTTYTREILAASNTILMDEIAYCPKDLFSKIMTSKRQTYAICEICGGAYCSKHIRKVNDSYYCKEHK